MEFLKEWNSKVVGVCELDSFNPQSPGALIGLIITKMREETSAFEIFYI